MCPTEPAPHPINPPPVSPWRLGLGVVVTAVELATEILPSPTFLFHSCLKGHWMVWQCWFRFQCMKTNLLDTTKVSFQLTESGPQSLAVLLGLLQSSVTLPGAGEGAVHSVGVLPLFHPLQVGMPYFLEHSLGLFVDQGPLPCHCPDVVLLQALVAASDRE